MRRLIFAGVVTAGLFIGGAGPALAATEHCPDHNGHPGKVETGDNNNVVLAVGTLFCVKGSNDATGYLVADGETTLFDYLDNGHDVSYYVVYETPDEEEPPGEEEPPAEEESPTTTTTLPSTTTTTTPIRTAAPVDVQPLPDLPVEAPHIVCPDGYGFTFKTDQPECPPAVDEPQVLARVAELPRTGSDWISTFAALAIGLVTVGGILYFGTKR
jgi:LPXTG-motif cell wall-anchored protein